MAKPELEAHRGIQGVGASRWSLSYLHVIAAGVALVAIAFFAMRRLGLHEAGYPEVLAATISLGVLVLWGRHRAVAQRSANDDGPRVFDLLLCSISFTAFVFALCWWGDVPYPLSLSLMMLVVGATVGVMVVYVDQRLWWTALAFVIGAVAIMAVPEYRGVWMAIAAGMLVVRDLSSVQRAAVQTELLARAREALCASLDYETTLETVARLPVPRFADWCAVDVLEDGVLRRMGVAHIDPAKLGLVQASAPRRVEGAGAGRGVLATLSTVDALRSCSCISVPLMRGEEELGVIVLGMSESRRIYGSNDLEFGSAFAGLAAVAIENARLYREAERARAQAELASHAKDDFLAMLGHELRNPLAPIMTSLEAMKLHPDEADVVERARSIIERQSRALARLVDDLLDVSRIAHGRIELQRERVGLAELVAEALEVTMPTMERRKHRVEVEVGPGLVVDADRSRMVQVLVNLLNNAAKYTEPGGRIVVHGETQGKEVVLRVRDDGTGIAPDMLPRVFEVFVQQPQGIDRAQGGLGLGLAIVKSLVELHGGRVTVHSEGLGRGTELVVCVPLAAVAP